MKKSISYILMAAAMLAGCGLFSSCEKVSPQGVLLGNTSVDDRVRQSLIYYSYHGDDLDWELVDSIEEYTFLVAATATSPSIRADCPK